MPFGSVKKMHNTQKWDYKSYPGYRKYPNLFKPIMIGNLTIPNRIKYAATEDNLNDRSGFVTDAEVAYIRERAKGVIGGICTIQGAYIDEKGYGQSTVGQAAVWDDKFIPGLSRLANVIHQEGAIAACQLTHYGRSGALHTPYSQGPSAIPQRLRFFKPAKEMSTAEIEQCIQDYAGGARRMLKAGFDIIELPGIAGTLISNFLSKYTNRRKDAYGGDIRQRTKFMEQIIKAIKKECGDQVPLGIRLCAEELLEDVKGNSPEECMITYEMAEAAGVDYISVTVGWQESTIPVISRDVPIGSWIHLAKRAKKHVKVPITMAYRLFRPDLPNNTIGNGELDIWEMCRSMIADPLMPKKVLEGREDEIRCCVACNLCLARLFRDAPMTCYINPLCAHEWNEKFHLKSAEEEKDIMIVGAGPAGLECAYVAAQRGHEVHVYDKREAIGGTLLEATKAPYGDEELMTCVDYQKTMCEKAGVNFHLGTEMTEELIQEEMPDSVVLATGPIFSKLKGSGGDRKNVVNVLDVLNGKEKVGEKVVVWGNRKPGIGVALFLAKQGKKVTIVGRESSAGFDINPSFKWRYMFHLKQNGVIVYSDCDIEEVDENEIVVKTFDGYRFPIECDTVIVSEREANDSLKTAVQGEGIELFVIGDALVPRSLSNAVHDGYRIGIRI